MTNAPAIAALAELAAAEDAAAAMRIVTRARETLGEQMTPLVPVIRELLRRVSEIDRLRRQVGVDELTGAANRRAFEQALTRELARTGRGAGGPSVLLFDLDSLKQLNDEHGHQAGDTAIKATVDALQFAVRATDVVARLGGDEFAVLLPETDAEAAQSVAQRLRGLVELQVVHGRSLRVSVGWASAERRVDPAVLLSRADSRLYADKRARRRTLPPRPATVADVA